MTTETYNLHDRILRSAHNKNDGCILILEELLAKIEDHDLMHDECESSDCDLHSNISKQYFDYELGIYLYRIDDFSKYIRALKMAYDMIDQTSPKYDSLLEELSRQGIKVPTYGLLTCPASLRVDCIE